MATIGDLVVNFSANSRDFERGTSRVQSGLRSLTSVAARAAAAIGGVFAVKNAIQAAASVETMAVKFKVLTKSEEKAEKVMRQITDLAASTPFQKMDIADAVQKLLAFGTSADIVIDEVARLGDIAALTGNPIGELADLYGKARVQGRLFGEDINQLTGRGIPIIQELAKQFGVAESEVKKLVEQGKVGFPQIQQAFIDMTTGSGMFANGMQQLSQTTEGKLSTLKDQLTEIAVQFGQVLLPHVTKFVDILSQGLQPGGAIQRGLTLFIDQLTSSIRLIQRLAASSEPILETYMLLTGQQLSVRAQDTASAGKRGFGGNLNALRNAPAQVAAAAAGPVGAFNPNDLFTEQQRKGMVGSIVNAIGNAYQTLPEIAGNALGSAGQFVAETLGLDNQEQANQQLAGALSRGSQEAYSAIVRATQGQRQEQAAQQTAQATQESANLLGEIATGFQSFFGNVGVVGSFS